KAAASGRLHQKTFAGLHLVAARCWRLDLVGCAEPHHETATSAGLAAGKALRRKARFVEPTDHRGVCQELIFAPHAQAAAPLAGATGVRHEFKSRDPAWKLCFKNLNRRGGRSAQ